MDALKNISSTVPLLEKKFSLSIERRLDEAVEGIKALQQNQECLERQIHQGDYMKKHSVSSTPVQLSRICTVSSSTPVQLLKDKTNRVTVPKSASPDAGGDLEDKFSLTFYEDGEDGENDCIEIEVHVTKEEIFRLSRASASRKNFVANLVRRVFTMEERASSNVKGVLGKQKLDPAKIAYVHK